MNFYAGVKGNFPFNDSVYDLKYLSTQVPNKYLTELAVNLYSDGQRRTDSQMLQKANIDAVTTNDFYVNGQLYTYMQQLWDKSQMLDGYMNDLESSISDIISNVTIYNDNLERAKRKYCGYEIKNSIVGFNNAGHIKREWDTTHTVGYTTYTRHHIEYWRIEDYQGIPYENVEALASKATSMESSSGIRFMTPRDWKNKIKRTTS